MTSTARQYANPPIVEAVVDIECDFDDQSDFASWEASATEAFSDHYPKRRTQHIHEFSLRLDSKEAASISNANQVQAFQFLHEDEKQLVQVRRSGYSFNRLAPYTNLSDYLPEIARSWRRYVETTKPQRVTGVQLRFINRILLPLRDGALELNDYFLVGPKLPEVDGLAFTGFLIQNLAKEQSTGHEIQTVLATESPTNNSLPVIFDNAAKAVALDLQIDDWSGIEKVLLDLRRLKNSVFENTLATPCLNLFS